MHDALSNKEDLDDQVGITIAKIWSTKDTIMQHEICGILHSSLVFNANCLKNRAPASLRGRGQVQERINIIQNSQHRVVSIIIAKIESSNRLVHLATSHAAVA